MKVVSATLILLATLLLNYTAYGASIDQVGPIDSEHAITPTHQYIVPSGKQIQLGQFPIDSVVSKDGNYLIVTNAGMGMQSIQVVDLTLEKVIQTITYKAPEALFFGMVFSNNGKELFVSGGGNNKIRRYAFIKGKLKEKEAIKIGTMSVKNYYPADMVMSASGAYLFVVNNLNDSVSKIDLKHSKVIQTVKVGKNPISISLDHLGHLFITNWANRTISALDSESMKTIKTIKVGLHPNAIISSPKLNKVFVANSDSDTISVIDSTTLQVTRTISLHSGKRKTGSQPDALALSVDEGTLFVANAGDNTVQVYDMTDSSPHLIVTITTGWYPTHINVLKNKLLIINGKGLGSGPNDHGQFVTKLMEGTLSIIHTPFNTKNESINIPSHLYNKKNNYDIKKYYPYLFFMKSMSPIKHVFYVIKENRTYDQVFGDLKRGNGSPELATFGERVTPNLHKLANQFVILDNFYADAEVSPQGHNWSMAAKSNDYVEKNWMAAYSGRNREYDFEGENKATYPKAGFLWNNAKRSKKSYRVYGEFMKYVNKDHIWQPKDKSIGDHFDPKYPGFNLNISDVEREKEWEREFKQFVIDNNLPQLQIIRLPNDHTYGTTPGKRTPEAYVAQNDYAVGRLVDIISHSEYWRNSAIFIVEDDSQNGWDHVDAHRTEALVISPYTQKQSVDSTFYDTASMLKTIEDILGMGHMTEFDSTSMPMFNTFTSNPDFTPYRVIKPIVSLNKLNRKDTPGAKGSQSMNFSVADSIDEEKLNHILWNALRPNKKYPESPYNKKPAPNMSSH